MKLHVTRSQSAKSKFFGGTETVFSLLLRAEVPDAEVQLIKKHDSEQYAFDLPDDFSKLMAEKQLEGPLRLTIPDLTRGIQYNCKFLARSFCALPQTVLEDYQSLLGRIRAREDWGGNETFTVEY